MSWQTDNPWRCWERTTLPAVVNGPDGLLVRVALADPARGAYQNEFRWPALVRLGPNDFAGRYAQVTLRFLDVRWSFEAVADGPRTIILVRCLDPAAARTTRIHLEALAMLPGGRVVTRENEVLVSQGDRAWRIAALSPSANRSGTTIVAPLGRLFAAVIEPVSDASRLEQRDVHLRMSAGDDAPLAPAEREAAARVGAARHEFLDRFRHIPRELWWAYAAVPFGIGWNLIWADDRREPIWVCSRDWCVHGNYGDWVMFNWDQFVVVAMAAEFDPALAHAIAGPQVAVQQTNGLIPGIASPLGVSGDRSMPPVAAFGLLKAYRLTGDRSFIDRYYEPLCCYHDWWLRHRDGNGDGLLEYGSDPVPPPHPQWQAHTLWASRYETGMDNHPMWDDVRFNPHTNTQEQADAGLSALHALDAICLAHMADVLGRRGDAERFRAYAERTGRTLDAQLWNDDVGLWLPRDWNGAWNHRASPTCFYPIFLPTVGDAHVERAIRDHLRNPRRFGGRYAMPACPRDDPAYPEQYYVRGRIWPENTLLVHAALRERGIESPAAELARASLETLRGEWLDHGYLRENYNADTARSDDTPESDLIYSFGMMLPWIAWRHLRDVRLDGTPVTAPLESLGEHLDGDGSLRARIDPVAALSLPGVDAPRAA